MKIGTWVEWTPPQIGNFQLNSLRGWIVAAEGDWFVVRVSSMRAPQAPFGTFHRDQLTVIPEVELVQRGAPVLS